MKSVLARLGVDDAELAGGRVRPPLHDLDGRRDTRVTTRYNDGDVESLLSSLHETGTRSMSGRSTPRWSAPTSAAGTSMSIHESQSKLWENHVARSPAFAEVLAAELLAGGFAVAPRSCTPRSSASSRR